MTAAKDDSPAVSPIIVGLIFLSAIAILFIQAPISSALGWAWFLKPFFVMLRFVAFITAFISGLALIRLKASWLPIAVLLFWTWGVSVEGYYFAFGGNGAPFVLKPWGKADVVRWLDLANPNLLGKLWGESQYLYSMVLCTAVQLAQAGVGLRAGIAHLPKTERIVLRIIAGFCYALDLFSALRSMPSLSASPLAIVGFALQFTTMIFGFELLLIALFAGFSGISNYFSLLSGKMPKTLPNIPKPKPGAKPNVPTTGQPTPTATAATPKPTPSGFSPLSSGLSQP